jgi:hypothetical protein
MGDAVRMLQAAAGLPASGCVHLADLNCDGVLTGKDALIILTFVVRPNSSLPAGCPLP